MYVVVGYSKKLRKLLSGPNEQLTTPKRTNFVVPPYRLEALVRGRWLSEEPVGFPE